MTWQERKMLIDNNFDNLCNRFVYDAKNL